MVAEDFLQNPQIRDRLDGVEPAWTLLTFESLRALRHEPSAVQTAIRIDLPTTLQRPVDLPALPKGRGARKVHELNSNGSWARHG
jgi:hypothetical protein